MPHICPESTVEQSRPEGSSALQGDANRSAFTPYKPSTVLTNLQRGNVPTQTPAVPVRRCIHQLSAQGEIHPEELGSERIEMKDEGGLTPLLWASAHGQLSTVRLLVDRGARVQATGNRGETALLLASAGGHSHVVRHLIQHGARPNLADQVGASSLSSAECPWWRRNFEPSPTAWPVLGRLWDVVTSRGCIARVLEMYRCPVGGLETS
ncbi:hypothetical protein HPB47_010485 [Ixodes persulcatus]|uniref:Uncharacterized protein n=1 Tax=Ixodes persulcatus TaxID=34615 RepID=A0AC60NZ91_IXOPE|nr:hypothetical protein HPB47_010485 [Ixodes persulcatus]